MDPRPSPEPLSVWRPVAIDRFLVGAAHYPEHVDESYWDRDAERMAAAGFNTVRMAEFAWHLFEPREGEFDFHLFDRAIEVLGRHGIKTILCTPTAAPPRWLTMHYPEVLRVDGNGRSMGHGSRQHADTSSPMFRVHSRRITRAMAEHYRDNPNVVGWQTDNELNTTASRSYSETTRLEFQKYLEDRYSSIASLNHAWGADFWATAYASFDQVVLPFDLAPAPPSPGHAQDYHRFLAFATARFQHDQVEILREVNPSWFVFHNLGRLDDIDFRGQFGTDLDFLGFDIYPMLYDESHRIGGVAMVEALHLDICRAYTGNFIVPEQQSGFGAQPHFVTMTPEPGEMRRMAFSSVARGADGLLFFRWRPAHFGAEIYWMGIIDHDDIPRRRYDEARQFARDIATLQSHLLGTSVRMDVGIAGADFDNQEAHRAHPMALPSPLDDAIALHRHCYGAGIACGFIHPEDDLSRLKLLYVPHWVVWNDAWTSRVEAFVRAGGTLVLGARTGTRDANNHVIRQPAPGRGLAALAGVTVEEFGRFAASNADGLFEGHSVGVAVRARHEAESAQRRHTLKLGNHEVVASYMYELLEPAEGTETLAAWSSRFATGRPAITSRSVGSGRVVYVGTYLDSDLTSLLFDDLFASAGIAPLLAGAPDGVEVTMRQAAGRGLLFILNTTDAVAKVPLVDAGTVLVQDGVIEAGMLALPPYGCAVLLLSTEGSRVPTA